MNAPRIIVDLLLLLTQRYLPSPDIGKQASVVAHGQNPGVVLLSDCDTVYRRGIIPPHFPGGKAAQLAFLQKEILPLVAGYESLGRNPINRLHIALLIAEDGEVMAATVHTALRAITVRRLEAALCRQAPWTPGRRAGRAVCAEVHLPVNCVKWVR